MANISEDQITPVVAQLLAIIELQIEEIQLLKDEIARLKGQKPKPKIKPSILQNQKRSAKKQQRRKRANKSKSKKLEIHQVISIAPNHIPAGITFKGYQDYTVQDLIIANWNICYRRQRWQTPKGDYIVRPLHNLQKITLRLRFFL